MTATTQTTDQARQLRLEGASYREIARELGVSTSAAYIWSRDVEPLVRHPSTNGKVTPEVAAEMRRLRAAGESLHSIGERFGVSGKCVTYWAGDVPTEWATTRPVLMERARAMRADGAYYQQIADEVGVGVGTARVWTADVPTGVPSSTAARHIRARAMRADGATYKEIADEFGVSTNTARVWTAHVETPNQRARRELASSQA